jgi:preprotein translocase subunit SecD
MRRSKNALINLLGIVVVAALLVGLTFKLGHAPLLGLDLEGGVSVRLTPTSEATPEQIDQAIAIMNQRINSLGVAEPDIHSEGGTIVVQIAGLKDEDKDKAIALVGQTAELRFRPVLENLPPESAAPAAAPPGSTPSTTAAPGPTTTVAPAPSGTAQTGMALPGAVEGESAAGAQAPTTVSDQPAAPAATAAAPNACGSATTAPAPDKGSTTTPEQDNKQSAACEQVILKGDPRTEKTPQRYLLGPACNPPTQAGSCLTGAALDGASANISTTNGKWTVNPVFKGGADGIDKFNALAAKCFQGAAECPTKQMAITLDGLVLSAPSINAPNFDAERIEISGSFDEETAKSLATGLKYGSLPVQLRQESSEAVSATLGRDALNAGLAAGAVGFLLVALYMIAFYRLLGVMAILKLVIEGMLMWAIISTLSATAGLALTLAGVTGIIVSIGVSLDSNVVYYEHLREDIRSGRTLRSSVERSFGTAWGTILKADGASLLGAALLYWLAVGPVRGFAFFLALSTILELITSYFFMRPAVFLCSRTKLCQTRPGYFGLPHDIAVAETAPSGVVSRPSRRGRPSGAPRPAPGLRPKTGPGSPPDEGATAGGTANGTEASDPSDTDPATTEAK